jgi:hypothetical protein
LPKWCTVYISSTHVNHGRMHVGIMHEPNVVLLHLYHQKWPDWAEAGPQPGNQRHYFSVHPTDSHRRTAGMQVGPVQAACQQVPLKSSRSISASPAYPFQVRNPSWLCFGLLQTARLPDLDTAWPWYDDPHTQSPMIPKGACDAPRIFGGCQPDYKSIHRNLTVVVAN